jgi:hypothetical protein
VPGREIKPNFEGKVPDFTDKHSLGSVLLLQIDIVKRVYQSRGIGTLTKVRLG